MASPYRLGIMVLFTLLAYPVMLVTAQEEELTLRFRRLFGSSLAGQMQGTFSFVVGGPDSVTEVEFLIDGQVIGKDSEAPFQLKFKTGDYEEGTHSLSAIGYAEDGRRFQTGTVRRQFVSGSKTIWIVGGIVAIAVALRVVSGMVTRQRSNIDDTRPHYGYLGGAICPNCGRPFPRHWWGLNLFTGRLDRCPHCRKWNMVQRASGDDLRAAEHFNREIGTGEEVPAVKQGDRDHFRKKLDDSRYEDN